MLTKSQTTGKHHFASQRRYFLIFQFSCLKQKVLIAKLRSYVQQHGRLHIARILLNAGANWEFTSSKYGTAREIAQREWYVEIVFAIDRHRCRNLLVELCIGMYAEDFPVLVALEIRKALCSINGLHEAEFGTEKQRRWLSLPEGHLKESVSWEIAKKVKHYLD